MPDFIEARLWLCWVAVASAGPHSIYLHFTTDS